MPRGINCLHPLAGRRTRRRMPRAGVESGPLQQPRQLGDVGGDAPGLVARERVCQRPAAGNSAADFPPPPGRKSLRQVPHLGQAQIKCARSSGTLKRFT
jgi:hypothetical protein